MDPVRLILVGGFLGAGKTTLLWEAANRLTAQGKRVGLITNDQAPDLVDTNLLEGRGFDVREVAGSCFCCNFQGLLDAADALRGDVRADVLLAEPVGSCTDLSATILQPLKDRYRQDFELAPLSVLTDPFRLRQILTGEPGRMHPSPAYIFEKQLEEADWIVVAKSDRVDASMREELAHRLSETHRDRPVKWLSSRTGDGLDDWLADALTEGGAGARVPDVDYDTYAEGEAVLGWVNAVASVESDSGMNGRMFCADVLTRLRDAAAARSAEIGHIKVLLNGGGASVSGNVTSLQSGAEVHGEPGMPIKEGTFLINARVEMAPDDLSRLCAEAIGAATPKDVSIKIESIHSLRPGRPVPTHRYTRAI